MREAIGRGWGRPGRFGILSVAGAAACRMSELGRGRSLRDRNPFGANSKTKAEKGRATTETAASCPSRLQEGHIPGLPLGCHLPSLAAGRSLLLLGAWPLPRGRDWGVVAFSSGPDRLLEPAVDVFPCPGSHHLPAGEAQLPCFCLCPQTGSLAAAGPRRLPQRSQGG